MQIGSLFSASSREDAEAGLTLRQALDEGAEAAFRFETPCLITNATGNEVSSAGDDGASDGFSRELSREEVDAAVRETLMETRLLLEDGDARLQSGEPATLATLGEKGVSISFGRQFSNESGSQSESLTGSVDGSLLQGIYYLEKNLSYVEAGQGVESATTIRAEISCQLRQTSLPAER